MAHTCPAYVAHIEPDLLTYGCSKPQTTSTLTNYAVPYGTHDATYSQVRFEGNTGEDAGSWAVLRLMLMGAPGVDTYNITFDRCVFATCPAGIEGNGVHGWNFASDGSTIHHITFDHCWFEPQPRMQLEMNGRGGWFHDLTAHRCTFEPSNGQLFSVDMSATGGDPASPYGISVDGVVRGVEGVTLTENDFQGTGAVVNGFDNWTARAIELRCVRPSSIDGSGGTVMRGNRVGRCRSGWFNLNASSGTYGLTVENNLFDTAYNPAGLAYAVTHDSPWAGGVSDSTFSDNVYVLGSGGNEPWDFMPSAQVSGDGNTFAREHWTKPGGGIGGVCEMPFTDSTYTGCHFHLPKAVTFAADAAGSGCVFDNGYVNGTFT